MRAVFIDSIKQISAEQWNAIAGTDYPFSRHEFLLALEISGATNRQSGWQPQHLLIFSNQSDDHLIALMPLYIKHHSYGEYVFDWSWADAYHRNGIDYYPKLLSAIPFTPATGPRLCIRENNDVTLKDSVTQFSIHQIRQHAVKLNASSIHILFSPKDDSEDFNKLGITTRCGAQFHWFNNDYQSFDDFIKTFNSRKRKTLNKERSRVTQQNLTLKILEGPNIPDDIWRRFHYFYQITYAKRSGHGGYLNQQFFELIAKSMTEHIVLVLAYYDGEVIAGALNFRDKDTLYGRYWGCLKEFDFLHFEACYYQGIEYCISNNLQRFDPGAQGEHKIQRGFNPIETYSNHWISESKFSAAINDFIQQDNAMNADYIIQCNGMLPFKKH
jgi:predicted N-acyltransferase